MTTARTWLIASLSAALWACAQHEPEPRSASIPASPTEAVAFVREVRALHLRASGRAGLVELRALADRNVAHGLGAEELAAVRRDLYGHAAKLAIEAREFSEAEALIHRGLGLEGADPFRVQLHMLAAELAYALGDAEAEERALSAARAELDALQ